MTDTFPRQQARTKRFSLGVPRSFEVSPDGARIIFLRSKSGTDPVTCLWVLDPGGDSPVRAGAPERLVVDPAVIGGTEEEPQEERARRERSRESAGGVVAFAADAGFTLAAFAIAGRVYTAELAPGREGAKPTSAMSPAIDPRPDPSGQRVAYVCDGTLRITTLATGADARLIGPDGGDGPDVTYGLAEYVAAEEMGRYRGYWWSPDGEALLVARVDNGGVQRWHIADPANPDRPPVQVRYPSAGTPNAIVSLQVVGLDGTTVPVRWDSGRLPVPGHAADWGAARPLIVVQSRDQRLMRLLAVDPGTGETSLLREDTDPCWVDIVPGVPARTADGLSSGPSPMRGPGGCSWPSGEALREGSAAPVTPAGLQVREVLSVDRDTVLFAGVAE